MLELAGNAPGRRWKVARYATGAGHWEPLEKPRRPRGRSGGLKELNLTKPSPHTTASRASAVSSQIFTRLSIGEVWAALGGGPLRHGRGRAFWRDGDGYNISLKDAKGTWYDFTAGTGGGVLDLIQLVRDCSRQDALRWLSDFAGIPLLDRPLSREEKFAYADARAGDERDRREARWFGRAVEALLEHVLDELDAEDWERAGLTGLLGAVRHDASRLREYRAWRGRQPQLTAGMVAAGAASEAKARRDIAALIGAGAEVAA